MASRRKAEPGSSDRTQNYWICSCFRCVRRPAPERIFHDYNRYRRHFDESNELQLAAAARLTAKGAAVQQRADLAVEQARASFVHADEHGGGWDTESSTGDMDADMRAPDQQYAPADGDNAGRRLDSDGDEDEDLRDALNLPPEGDDAHSAGIRGWLPRLHPFNPDTRRRHQLAPPVFDAEQYAQASKRSKASRNPFKRIVAMTATVLNLDFRLPRRATEFLLRAFEIYTRAIAFVLPADNPLRQTLTQVADSLPKDIRAIIKTFGITPIIRDYLPHARTYANVPWFRHCARPDTVARSWQI
ncbi:hypothetical protein B0A53_03116 [Rhodotorula sp. CCFEE 5036]|nr:hypothetical protein B0A53_03116 [Rhodotorula sp. CCFEE 5036]